MLKAEVENFPHMSSPPGAANLMKQITKSAIVVFILERFSQMTGNLVFAEQSFIAEHWNRALRKWKVV